MKTHLPRMMFPEWERESTLTKHRINRGYTEDALAKLVDSRQHDINQLSIGHKAPIYLNGPKKGQLRDVVVAISTVLEVPASELFPGYICEVDFKDLPDDLISDLLTGEWSKVASKVDLEELESEELSKRLLFTSIRTLTPSMKIVLVRRFFNGETLEEIAIIMKLTRERVRQIEKKAINKIRNFCFEVMGIVKFDSIEMLR